MKSVILFSLVVLALIGCATTQPSPEQELQAMSRGPAIGTQYTKEHCRPGGVWLETGMTVTYADGQKRPAVGIHCLSKEDRLVAILCEKTGTICQVMPYEKTGRTVQLEEELRRLEAKRSGRRL